MSFEKYADLAGTGFTQGTGKEVVAPEDEIFHSIYVAGQDRKNHLNELELSGKLQIRGVEYNLDEIYMIITHTKEVLCKVKHNKDGENIECFSFKEGSPPWYSTTTLQNGERRTCPLTSAERAVNDFCSTCRAQIIVAGLRCEKTGHPILEKETNKPVYVFLRGKGMRYSNVSNYLGECFKAELPPLFEPVTIESEKFEKSVVNNKRFVTIIGKTKEKSSYGSTHDIFTLTQGIKLDNQSVIKILEISRKTLEDFNNKFDWTKNKTESRRNTPESPPEGVMTIEDKTEEVPKPPTKEKTFSFDDINF